MLCAIHKLTISRFYIEDKRTMRVSFLIKIKITFNKTYVAIKLQNLPG
jgi:hypothetical protein